MDSLDVRLNPDQAARAAEGLQEFLLTLPDFKGLGVIPMLVSGAHDAWQTGSIAGLGGGRLHIQAHRPIKPEGIEPPTAHIVCTVMVDGDERNHGN